MVATNVVFIFICSVLVFLMTPGLAFFTEDGTQEKHQQYVNVGFYYV